jgi:hypothetical protein
MLYKLPLLICLLLVFYTGKSQSTEFDIVKYVEQMPLVAGSANEAYQQFYPKGKHSVYQQFEATLQAQINALADESKHQSYLLSMLAGRIDQESRQYNFTKVVIAEDPELKKKRQEQIGVFFNIVDYYSRMTSWTIDSIRKKEESYAVQAEKMIGVYQQVAPVVVKKLKVLIKEMNDLMNKKGYNAVLNNKVTTHKYYIQLLEVRGLLLDRIKQINRMIDGSCGYVAVIQAEAMK